MSAYPKFDQPRYPVKLPQGFEMGHPSMIQIEIAHTAGAISGVSVGGEGVFVDEGSFEV